MQGPYKLSGINNEKYIIIIAGGEKVYLNGERLKRGENNDYVIDYANAAITFTTNKLITSDSRIAVDFEYTDKKYERTFFSVNARKAFFENKLNLSLSGKMPLANSSTAYGALDLVLPCSGTLPK